MRGNSRQKLGFLIATMAFCVSAGMSLAQQSDDMANMPGMKMSMAPAAAPASSASGRIGALDVSGGYVKAMLPGQPVGGGYVTIHNGGNADDRLVSISSPEAGKVELHEMTMQGDVMKMRELKDGITLPAGATVALSPNAMHMMFLKVKSPFKQGGSVSIRLTFEKAGALDIVLPVTSPRGM